VAVLLSCRVFFIFFRKFFYLFFVFGVFFVFFQFFPLFSFPLSSLLLEARAQQNTTAKQTNQRLSPRPHVLLVEVHDEVAVVLQNGFRLPVGRDELLALVEDGAGAEERLGNHFWEFCFGLFRREEEEEAVGGCFILFFVLQEGEGERAGKSGVRERRDRQKKEALARFVFSSASLPCGRSPFPSAVFLSCSATSTPLIAIRGERSRKSLSSHACERTRDTLTEVLERLGNSR
jgi:hypothetical protein